MSNPIRHIRDFLKNDPTLKAYSTQRAFADLLEYSPSLIQSIERGATPVSDRLAGLISNRLGVDPAWLQQQDPDLPIPSVDGAAITHKQIKQKIAASDPSQEPEFSKAVALEGLDGLSTAEATAALLARLVRDAQLTASQHNDYQFVADILRALDECKDRTLRAQGTHQSQINPPPA